MYSKTLFSPAVMTASKPLAPAACSDICQFSDTHDTDFHPVRMNWVVVRDETEHRRLQMHWERQ